MPVALALSVWQTSFADDTLTPAAPSGPPPVPEAANSPSAPKPIQNPSSGGKSAFENAPEKTCLLLSQTVQAISTVGAASVPIKKGRIVPSVSKDLENRSFTIHLVQGDYIVNESDVKIGTPGLCSAEPLCAVTQTQTAVFEEPDSASKKIIQIGKGASLNWFGRRTIKKTNTLWYQVEAGEGFGWILGSTTELQREACKIGNANRRNGPSAWILQIDLLGESGVSSLDYSGAVSKIPDSSDVQGLEDPLIRSFEKGSGARYGANFNYDFNPYFNARFGLFYAETKLKYLYSPNPGSPDMNTPIDTLPPVDLSELAIESKPFVEQKLIFPVSGGLGYTFFRMIRFNMSVGTDFQFYVKERKLVLDYYTGTRMKRELNTIEVKPEQFTLDPWAELRLSFLFPGSGSEKLGFSLVGRASASGAVQAGLSFQL